MPFGGKLINKRIIYKGSTCGFRGIRMDLYIALMRGSFREENGGSAFIAVKLDTLDGLSDQAKLEGLKELGILSPNVYSYDDVKDDSTKFVMDDEGR